MRYTADFQTIREMTRDAARTSFGAMLCEHPNEDFYGFSLYTISDAAGPVSSASTLKGFAERERKIRADEKEVRWLADQGIDLETHILTDAKWSPFEWEFEFYRADAFDAVSKYVNDLAGISCDDKTRELNSMLLAAYVAALGDLDRDGQLGKYLDRSKYVLFCSIADSSDAVWYEKTSARILNPDSAYDQFFRECIRHLETEDEIRMHQRFGLNLESEFTQYISLCE